MTTQQQMRPTGPQAIYERLCKTDFEALRRDAAASAERLRAQLSGSEDLDDFFWWHQGAVERMPEPKPLHVMATVASTTDEHKRLFAWRLSVMGAAARVCLHGRRCSHLNRLVAGDARAVPEVALVTASFACVATDTWTCLRCAGQHRTIVNDTDCDLCGDPTETFREMGDHLGRTLVITNVCQACFAFIQELRGSDEERPE
jgi:hypothetical protein